MKIVAIFEVNKEEYKRAKQREPIKKTRRTYWDDWTIEDEMVRAVIGGIMEYAMDYILEAKKVWLVDEENKEIKLLAGGRQ